MKVGKKVFASCILLVLFIAGTTAFASDLSLYTTVYGTDFASAGYGGIRDIGTGSISLSGVSGTVDSAFLYWHGPSNVTDPSANAIVTFNGNQITGTSLGLSSDNCWLFDCSIAYRADVTQYVSGNGTYSLDGFLKDGGDININGISLVAFFDDGNTSNDRDVVIFDGNDSNILNSYDALGWNITLSGINYSSGSASLQLHVSDGQTFFDDALLLNGLTLAPSGAIFSGDSVPNGASASNTSGGLWDIKSYDITSWLTPGLNTLNLTTGTVSDCLSGVVVMVDLPAGAAPPPPAIPEPTSLILLGSGLGVIGLAAWRRKK